MKHHHHNTINDYAREHEHSPEEHDADGRHIDGAFDEFDAIYGPAHDDHAPRSDNMGHNPYGHPTTHHDIDDAFE
jgi:hypothetical protein